MGKHKNDFASSVRKHPEYILVSEDDVDTGDWLSTSLREKVMQVMTEVRHELLKEAKKCSKVESLIRNTAAESEEDKSRYVVC